MNEPSAAARLAEAFRAVMKDQALNGAELAERIGRLTGTLPSPVWVSRRLGGSRPKNLIDVDPDLFLIARALKINRSDLIELVVRAVFGDTADEPIDYVLTGKCPDVAVGDHDCAGHITDGFPDHNDVHVHDRSASSPDQHIDFEVPARPTPAEYGDLPVLDRRTPDTDDVHACDECGQEFETKEQLEGHEAQEELHTRPEGADQ